MNSIVKGSFNAALPSGLPDPVMVDALGQLLCLRHFLLIAGASFPQGIRSMGIWKTAGLVAPDWLSPSQHIRVEQ
jgi:hypothetical protein